jgi:hypothetical protein
MKKLTGLWMGLCLLFGGLNVVAAQEMSGTTPPPKVLVIQREFIKPGKAGSLHQKTESAFVQAMVAAKWPSHYLALESLSGSSRALFLIGYDSFAEWEKDNEAMRNNATLSAALDRAGIADGDLLTAYDSGTFVYREDFSLRAPVNIAQMRYFEISRFVVRPGHEKDWEALVKLYKTGYEKAVPNAHWATYESVYGADNGGVYIVFNPMKSMGEIDDGFGDSKKFEAAMGEAGMKKLGELSASCLEASQTNLFMFSPKMSYVPDAWVKADPTFWKPKMTAPAKKPEAKPEQ